MCQFTAAKLAASACAVVFVFGSLACSGESQGAAGVGYETDCDTEAPPITTGDDYGEPYHFFVDVGDEKLDIGGQGGGDEVCNNGLDDDMDGSIDEFCACTTGALQNCFPYGAADPCVGVQECFGNGEITNWGECEVDLAGCDVSTGTGGGGDSDPDSWVYSSGEDAYYRSPTRAELDEHSWSSVMDILVIPPGTPLRDLSQGASIVDLSIPVYDRDLGWPQDSVAFRSMVLEAQFASSTSLVEQRWEDGCLRRQSHVVPFSRYRTRSANNPELTSLLAVANASSFRDSLAIFGGASDRMFSLRGPYSQDRVSLDVALPSGKTRFYVLKTSFDPYPAELLAGGGAELKRAEGRGAFAADAVPVVAPSGQCADGLDNDQDGSADSCDVNCAERTDFNGDLIVHDAVWENAKSVGLFGTISYCTANESAYAMQFVEWGQFAMHLLNNVVPMLGTDSMGYDPAQRPPPVRVAMAGCVVADSQADADECDSEFGQCVVEGYSFGSLYEGNWDPETGVLSRVWQYVEFLVEAGHVVDTRPIQTAVVFADVAPSLLQPDGGAVGFDMVTSVDIVGSAIVSSLSTAVGPSLAHEVGHTFGLAHDTAPNGFMNSGGGWLPVIDWEAQSLLPGLADTQGFVWHSLVQGKDHPRPPGFRYSGCVNDQDCSFAPGLVCEEKPGYEAGEKICRL